MYQQQAAILPPPPSIIVYEKTTHNLQLTTYTVSFSHNEYYYFSTTMIQKENPNKWNQMHGYYEKSSINNHRKREGEEGNFADAQSSVMSCSQLWNHNNRSNNCFPSQYRATNAIMNRGIVGSIPTIKKGVIGTMPPTLIHHEMWTLKQEHPEVYKIIRQQNNHIFHQNIQLERAWKDISKLQNQLKWAQSIGIKAGNNQVLSDPRIETENRTATHNVSEQITEEKKLSNNFQPDKSFATQEPPLQEIKEARTSSPSSQLTEESLPMKKRILESFQLSHGEYEQNKRKRSNALDSAETDAFLSVETSPKHENSIYFANENKRKPLPDIATVAAALAAATSPKFDRVTYPKLR